MLVFVQLRACPVNGVTGGLLLVSLGAEAPVESDVECVECALPALGPPGSAFACGVQGHDCEVDAFECGLLVREMAAGLDCFADA